MGGASELAMSTVAAQNDGRMSFWGHNLILKKYGICMDSGILNPVLPQALAATSKGFGHGVSGTEIAQTRAAARMGSMPKGPAPAKRD
jgi:hypothetical protein